MAREKETSTLTIYEILLSKNEIEDDENILKEEKEIKIPPRIRGGIF